MKIRKDMNWFLIASLCYLLAAIIHVLSSYKELAIVYFCLAVTFFFLTNRNKKKEEQGSENQRI